MKTTLKKQMNKRWCDLYESRINSTKNKRVIESFNQLKDALTNEELTINN